MLLFLKAIFFYRKLQLNWGPGVHLHLANKLLSDEELQNTDKEIIQNNRKHFLYGNVSPDITLGKKYIKELEKHCHKWDTAFRILKNAKNDEEKTLGYGYLTHLAADVIAHNYYIPRELLVGRGLRNFLHTVLEIKVDMTIYKETSSVIKELLQCDFKQEDAYLKKNISKALLPFGINRKIFEYSLKGSKSRYMYKAFRVFGNYENWMEENQNLLKKYHEISYKLMKDLLENMENSEVVKYDPNGEKNIMDSKAVKKSHKGFRKDKSLKEHFYKIPNNLLE